MNKNKDLKNRPLREDNNDGFFARLFSNQKTVALLILGATILLLFPLAKSYSQRKVIELEIYKMQQKIDDYKKNNDELQDLLSYINSSDDSIEEQARANLNMKKAGEGVIVIEELSEEEKKIKQREELENKKSNFRKWFNYFFG